MARDRELLQRLRSAFVALLALTWSGTGLAAPGLKGRPVSDVLRQLQDESLQFLFSNDLVKDSLLVGADPRTRDRLGIAREVLAEHGLGIRSVNPGLYIVVRRHDRGEFRTFTGLVVDATSGAPLSGARVELLPLGRVAWSDHSGRFTFDTLTAGEDYRVRATIEDYARGETPLRIDETGVQAIVSTIRLNRVALDTVVVEASRYALAAESANGSRRLDAMALANQPDVADDPIRALRRLPGVVQGGVSAASNLRGGETNEVLVLLDGYPLRQVYHLPGYQSPFTLLDENLIESIEVFTGGFPARYGNRLAGVFDITTTSAGQAPKTSMGLSFFNAHARSAGESADGRTDWRAAARVGTLRPVLEYLSVDGGRPGYSDLSLAATHRVRDVVLSGNVLWAGDEYSLDDDDEHAEVESRTRYSWLRADYAHSEQVTSSMWLGHSNIVIDRAGSVDKPEFAISEVSDHRDAAFWDARGNVNWQWSERSRLNAGFEWTQGHARYRYDAAASFPSALAELFGRELGFSRSLALSPEQHRAAVFVSQRWKLGERWMPEVGLRVQQLRIGSRRERTWDPRVGLRWEIRPRTGLRAHWGRFHQSDDVHELAVADGVTAFARAQRSEHLILGLEHRFTNGVQLRAEAFRKQQRHPRARFENLMSPIEVFAELAPDRVRVQPDESRMHGVEFSISLERQSWQGWSSISVARALDEFGSDLVPRSWDQRLAWTSGIDWQRGQWRVGGAATLRSGWPITPIGHTIDGDAILGARNADRMPAFASIDFRVEYRRPLTVGTFAVALEVSNLTNRRNQCCIDAEVEEIGTPEETIEVEKQFWPRLLPSLSVKWEF
jgi:outer membrane cobalamin receptor